MKRKKIKKRKARLSSPVGRIQVFVRIRPFGKQDVKCQLGRQALQVGNAEMTQVNVFDGKAEKNFEFDQVIPQETGNDQAYKIIGKPLVEACLTGMNGILMAYGQTGAGKTHTLMASNGVTPSIVNTIFSIIERDQTHSYTVTCSYLQIYQERIYDLLCAGKMREVFLREHPKKGVFVDHLSELLVRTPVEVTALFATGRKRLAVAETKMNRHSSRSHAICQLKIDRIDIPTRYGVYDAHACNMTSDLFGDVTFSGLSPPITECGYRTDDSTSSDVPSFFDYEEDDDVFSKVTTLTKGASTVRGRIYICDLAGSERIKKTRAQGERLQEAQAINSSLLELGNVIHALAEGKNNHVPFRNSVLTRFLQDGLSGNSKTYLVVCVSPSLSDVNETLCSLKFGLRAMKVESTAQVNIEVDYEKMARQLAETLENKEQEWRRLRSEFESYIMSLKANQKCNEPLPDVKRKEIDPPNHTRPWQKTTTNPTEESLKNQTKALLLVELVSMELFYGMEDLLRDGSNGKEVPTEKLYTLTDRDLLLHSAETLLELTEYFFTKSTPTSSSKSLTNGQDRIGDVIPAIGASFLPPNGLSDSTYTGKLLHVRSTLCRIKESTDKAAVKFLSRLLENDSTEPIGVNDKRKLHEFLREYVQRRVIPTREDSGICSMLNLEQSLCHVLIDKALINCILLLDKAEMEKKIRRLKEENVRCDYGLDTLLRRKKSAEESSTRSDGRLISVDEGVVLEGSELSTNSREKLAHPLESSSLAEMEAENRALCEKNAEMRRRLEDSEKHNEALNEKLYELEKKFKQSGSNVLPDVAINSNSSENDLLERLREAEIENIELANKIQTLEESTELLSKVETEAKTLRVQVQQLQADTKCEQPTALGIDKERTTLNSRLLELENELKSKTIDLTKIEKLTDENRKLKQELHNFQQKFTSIKSQNSEATEKSAKQRCSQLEERLLQLESRQNEELLTKDEELTNVKTKLQTAESRNSLFISKAATFETKLKDIGQLISRHRDNERCLQLKVDELEHANSILRKEVNIREDLKEAPIAAASDDLNIESDPFVLRERIVHLESQIFVKDQEIMCLKNEAVDLKSEVGKLDHDCNQDAHHMVKIKAKEIDELRNRKEEVENELQNVLIECSKLRNDVLTLMDENNSLREKIQTTSNVLKTSVSAVLSERNTLENDLLTVQNKEKDLESMLLDFECKNEKLQKDVEKREETVARLQHDLDELLTEKSKLNFSLSEMKDAHTNTAEENETLQQDLKTLEKNLCTLQESLTFCLNEKVALIEDLSIKAAELETLRTYSSLCAEETRSMKLQIDLYKDTEIVLNNRVTELEESLEEWKKESLRMKNELGSIDEERRCLDQRIYVASRAIDQVKEELISLMRIILGLQKDLLCLVDGVMVCLGLDSKTEDAVRQRLASSNDSGYASNATEISSERSSATSESNYAEGLASCSLLPDEYCFVNPSEISIIRENKTEIFRLHEELKNKLSTIKDCLAKFKDSEENFNQSDVIGVFNSPQHETEISREISGENLKGFPYLNKSERLKLTQLLSILRRDDTDEVYNIYSRLEEKLSKLSLQLATKELDICQLLKEKIKLQNELMKSKYGITLCDSCSSDPEKVNHSNELLRANLITYMEDTTRLETEIMDFAQYKAKLEKELSEVRLQITEIEDEIITSSESPPRNNHIYNSPRESFDSTNISSTGSESVDSGNEKKTKRVTFDKMVAEPKQTDCLFRKRKSREKQLVSKETLPSLVQSKEKSHIQPSDVDDIDLVALLESISKDVPKDEKVETEGEKEVAAVANRLSAYDNMSFDDKKDYVVVQRQNSDESAKRYESAPGPQRSATNPNVNKRNSYEGSNCKMCGLLRKKRSRISEEVYTVNTI